MDEPQPATEPHLKRSLEASLFVSDEPLPATIIAQALEVDRRTAERLCEELARDLEERGSGLVLRNVAGGWRLFTHPFVHVTWYHLLLDGSAFIVLYQSLLQPRRISRLALVFSGAAASLLVSLASTGLDGGLCALQKGRELRRLDAIAGRLLDFLPRPFQSPLRLVVQSDLDAFHDPIRRGDQVFRLLEGLYPLQAVPREANYRLAFTHLATQLRKRALVILFTVAQRYIIGGIALTGLKG